jgi:hypothetical protein
MHLTANITDESHVDHIPSETMGVVREIIRDGEARVLVSFPGFAILEVDLPEHLPSVACALRGPMTGEAPVAESDVFYGVRGERPNVSRLTRLPATQSRTVTVVVTGIEDGKGTLATAYGGPLAPQEPGDPFLPAEKLQESVEFWSQHALSLDPAAKTSIPEGVTFTVFVQPAAKE